MYSNIILIVYSQIDSVQLYDRQIRIPVIRPCKIQCWSMKSSRVTQVCALQHSSSQCRRSMAVYFTDVMTRLDLIEQHCILIVYGQISPGNWGDADESSAMDNIITSYF